MNFSNQTCQDLADNLSGVYPPKSFSGLWIEKWPNGSVRYRGHFLEDNIKIGQHLAFHDNGNVQEVSFWIEGWATGTTLTFRADGSKLYEKDYGEKSGVTRSWIERHYSIDSDLFIVRTYSNGQQISEWIRPDVAETWTSINGDNIVNEALKIAFPDE